jgi:hypothetical protein
MHYATAVCCCSLLTCRDNLKTIAAHMHSTSQQHPGIFSSTELQQATAAMPAANSGEEWSAEQLAAAAPVLLSLVSKSAVLLVLSVLSELLMYGRPQQQAQLLQQAGKAMSWVLL